MQIKTTVNIMSHMSEWLSSINQQVLVRMWTKGNPFAVLVGVETGVSSVEGSIEILQNIKNGSGSMSEGNQNTNLKEHKHPNVHCSVIYNRQDKDAGQVSISR